MIYPIHVVTDDENDVMKLKGWRDVPHLAQFVYMYDRETKYAIYCGIKLDDYYAAVVTKYGTFYLVAAVSDESGTPSGFRVLSSTFATYPECLKWYQYNVVNHENSATAQPEESHV